MLTLPEVTAATFSLGFFETVKEGNVHKILVNLVQAGGQRLEFHAIDIY